eukprot:TRINITY_DN5221_c2_g1_i1.p1 TRINITY_DN5221_c2_g1~~TRINITY_DN5221_c2_g1_i1.p1  ORF type:complete len:535 (+),score=73.41 TRINITY_DN5221_c2_g1_i1:137-1741(+)
MGLKEVADAILSGASDALVTQFPDGTMRSSSFCVRFGRLKVRTRGGKMIRLVCNGELTCVYMVIGQNGDCSFAGFVDPPNDFSGEGADPTTPTTTQGDGFKTYTPTTTQKALCKSVEATPDNDILQRLRLKMGRNDIQYQVDSKMRGIQTLTSRVFLVKSTTKLVISDIDGTITKSNVKGQIAGFLGRDFTHDGIARFYSKLADEGHQFIYLTSRPVTSNHGTRQYLDSIRQEHPEEVENDLPPRSHTPPPPGNRGSSSSNPAVTKEPQSATIPRKKKGFSIFNSNNKKDEPPPKSYSLPPGPVIGSPDSLVNVLVQEIKKEPHRFKIPALLEILGLFNHSPEPPRLNYGPESEMLSRALVEMGLEPAKRDCEGIFLPQGIESQQQSKEHPFVAAFGNAPTDLLSYYCVGVPLDRVYMVNTRSEIRGGNTTAKMAEIDESEYHYSDKAHIVNGYQAAESFVDFLLSERCVREEHTERKRQSQLSQSKLSTKSSSSVGEPSPMPSPEPVIQESGDKVKVVPLPRDILKGLQQKTV